MLPSVFSVLYCVFKSYAWLSALSVKGRDHLDHSLFYHPLAHSYIVALCEVGNVTSWKIQVIAGWNMWSMTPDTRRSWSMKLVMLLNYFNFYAYTFTSPVWIVFFFLVNSQKAICAIFPTCHSWNISLNLFNLYSLVMPKKLPVSLNKDTYP